MVILTLTLTSCRQADEENVPTHDSSSNTKIRKSERSSSSSSDTITIGNQSKDLISEEEPKNPPRI